MSRALVTLVIGAVACSDAPKVERPAGPTCADALRDSARTKGVQAENIEPAVRQCELEKWSAELKSCIATAPAGADLEATCFAKFKQR